MTEAPGLASALASRLQALWGTEAAVTGVRPLPGGASRESWDVRVRTADGAERSLILLREAGGRARYPDKKVAVEAAAMSAARAAGVPVAEIYDYGGGALGQDYLLMERLDGETIPRRLLRDEAYAVARPGLARRLGEVLARIHQVNPASVRDLPRVDALSQVTGLYQAFAEPRPALEIGLRWLAGHRPAPAADALVHGDFRTGNLMVGEDGLHGVLDWELAHRGDPRQDLGWLCTKAWRFGSASPVGGFGTRADLMAGYAAGGGTPPDEETQRWWELYGTVRWALLCRRQAERYLAGDERSIELAVLGRRVCEQEYDILLALGHAAPLTVADPLENHEDHAATPHDRPSGPELLRAVREFLITEVGRTEAGLGVRTDPRLRFHARVAANALRIAEREALLAPAHERAHRDRL
ncbi:MAG TPA: phosphotransferase family protein, partial [Streptosporangiaceae bacterium]|nr:phosphotransferase family protein [Streptosporangiaceae bacterium]